MKNKNTPNPRSTRQPVKVDGLGFRIDKTKPGCGCPSQDASQSSSVGRAIRLFNMPLHFKFTSIDNWSKLTLSE